MYTGRRASARLCVGSHSPAGPAQLPSSGPPACRHARRGGESFACSRPRCGGLRVFGSYSLTVARFVSCRWSGFRLSIAPPCRGVSAESNFNLERLRVQVVFRRRPHLRQAREAAVLAYAGACQAPAAARNPVASAGGHRRESNRGLKVAPTIQGLNDDPFDVGSTLKRPI